jgi:hypothetical protein
MHVMQIGGGGGDGGGGGLLHVMRIVQIMRNHIRCPIGACGFLDTDNVYGTHSSW